MQQGRRDTQREVAIVIALKAGQMTSCRFFGTAGIIAALLERPRTWWKLPKNLARQPWRDTGFLMVWAKYLYAGYPTCNYYRKATPDTGQNTTGHVGEAPSRGGNGGQQLR